MTGNLAPLLAFGAHPDDIEFGCGGVIARETRAGRSAYLAVCSKGEAASHGTPEKRNAEAEKGAGLLGAKLEFVCLDGDARLEDCAAHRFALATVIRRVRPGIVLAPTLEQNQHPDHYRLGQMVRDAARLARYGGITELRDLQPHAIQHLLFYAITPGSEPAGLPELLVDISNPQVLAAWTEALKSHASQAASRNYVELYVTRARLNGLRAGVGHAIALYPNDPLVLDSLAQLGQSARTF